MRRSKSGPADEAAFEEEAVIERLGHAGDGVTTILGRTVYVPYGAPGDRVRISVEGERGRLITVLAPGPQRVVAPCQDFGSCGGCSLQHLSDDTYRRFKHDGVRATLAQRGIDFAGEIEVVAGTPESRRRASFAFDRRDGVLRLGFHAAASATIVEPSHCLVLTPKLRAALPALRTFLDKALAADGEGTLAVTETQAGLDGDLVTDAPLRTQALARLALEAGLVRLTRAGVLLAQAHTPTVDLSGIPVAVPPAAFLQPTVAGEAALVAAVLKGVGGARSVCDLFAGLGTFSLPLARVARVHAVDGDGALIAALASAHRQAKGLKPLITEVRDLARRPLTAEVLSAFEAVVFDPPRAGAFAQAQAMAGARVRRVVAVSCNPATFARDARVLLDGGFTLDALTLVDQFLWSSHVELVATLSRGKARP